MLLTFSFIVLNVINAIIAGGPSDDCTYYNFKYNQIISEVNATINNFADNGIAMVNMYEDDNPSEPLALFQIKMDEITNDEFNKIYNEILKIFHYITEFIPCVTKDEVRAYILLEEPAEFPLTCITNFDVLQEIFLSSFQRLADYAASVALKHF
ncbi:hypothetical protein PVAND_009490 [Polypedilum vanderplanki]|uniref:Uncharacterized protein n=1 Tax=Polypedilum vanderplanki TaxID=319348 RepID=A0A9J6CDW0_POLVA|nr:hypothetical protein PVAND_009490 [Polypedilum vanderplanki]